MSERHVVVTNTNVGTSVTARQILRDFLVVLGSDLAKVLSGKLAQVSVVDTTSASQDHSWALVMGVDVMN